MESKPRACRTVTGTNCLFCLHRHRTSLHAALQSHTHQEHLLSHRLGDGTDCVVGADAAVNWLLGMSVLAEVGESAVGVYVRVIRRLLWAPALLAEYWLIGVRFCMQRFGYDKVDKFLLRRYLCQAR